MRKILRGVVITGIILALFFVARPFAAGLLNLSAPPETDQPESTFAIEQTPEISITQGGSDGALIITNQSSTPLTFNLGHAHTYLALEPRNYNLSPGSSRAITIHVDAFCPIGEIELTVYLLAEAEGESFGMETIDIIFDVLPGELALEGQNGHILVLWNNSPAPPGISLYYNNPDTDEEVWEKLGETPLVDLEELTASLDPGSHVLEFMARYGEIESEVKSFEVAVAGTADTGGYTPAQPVEEEPEYIEVNGMRYRIDYGDTELPREPSTIQIPPQRDQDKGIKPF